MSDISINEMWCNALAAYSVGKKQIAIDIFSIIAKTDARIAFNLACIYIEDMNYAMALKYLKNAIELNNSLSVAYFQRGYVRYQQGNFDSAHKNYYKALLLLNRKYVEFSGQGLDLTLYEDEIRLNIKATFQAKEYAAQRISNTDLRLFAIPQGLFFRPMESHRIGRSRKKFELKIDTNQNIFSDYQPLTANLSLSPFASERIQSPAQKFFSPISPDSIRIKVFWNSNDAMVILSHRKVQLRDLISQIRSKLKLEFDPTLINQKTGLVIGNDWQLWDYLNDNLQVHFQVRIHQLIFQ